MKRYDPIEIVGPNGDGVGMEWNPDGEYYSRADLIAAGVLVPVPDGEACEYGDSDCELMIVNGGLVGFDSCGLPVWLSGENEDTPLHAVRVQPVRLVPLEDVG